MKLPPPIVRRDGLTHYLIRLPRFDAEGVDRIRSIRGRRWSPEERAWRVPAGDRTDALLKRLFPGVVLPGREVESASSPTPRPQDPSGAASGAQGAATPSGGWTPDPRLSPADAAVLEEMSRAMVLAGLAPRTRKLYRGYARRFARWVESNLEATGVEEVRRYLVHLVEERGVSRSAHSQAVSSLRFLFERVLRRPHVIRDIPRPKKQKSLPSLLSRKEVEALLEAVRHPSTRALVMLLYSSGLRVSEVVRLRPEDLDRERGLLRVRSGKGRKDR